MAMRKFLPGLALALALSVSAPAYAHEAHEKAAAARAQVATPMAAVPDGGVWPCRAWPRTCTTDP